MVTSAHRPQDSFNARKYEIIGCLGFRIIDVGDTNPAIITAKINGRFFCYQISAQAIVVARRTGYHMNKKWVGWATGWAMPLFPLATGMKTAARAEQADKFFSQSLQWCVVWTGCIAIDRCRQPTQGIRACHQNLLKFWMAMSVFSVSEIFWAHISKICSTIKLSLCCISGCRGYPPECCIEFLVWNYWTIGLKSTSRLKRVC